MINLLNILFTSLLLVLSADNPFGNRIDYGRIDADELNEISGIDAGIVNVDVFWVHNDSGNDDVIYAIDKSGKLLAKYEIDGVDFVDLEDITIGPGPEQGVSYIYLADIGDNLSSRETKAIYRFKEPEIIDYDKFQSGIIDDIEVFSFSYPDGKRDAETLMIDENENKLLVVSKREDNVFVYQTEIPESGANSIILKKIATLPFGNEGYNNSGVTGGDISNDGSDILLKTYGKVYYYQRANTLVETFAMEPVEVNYIFEPQSEAICFGNDKEGFYTTSEASPLNITPHLYFYPRNTSANDEGMLDQGYRSLGDARFLNRDIYNLDGGKVNYNPAFLSQGLYLMRYRYIDTAFTRKIYLVK